MSKITDDYVKEVMSKPKSKELLNEYIRIWHYLTGENMQLVGCNACFLNSIYGKIIRVMKKKNLN